MGGDSFAQIAPHISQTFKHRVRTQADLMAPKYAKAPVAEAVIDIRAAVGAGVSADDFRSLVSQLAEQFPSSAPMQNFEMGVEQEIGQEAKFHTAHAYIGQRLQTADARRVLQLRLDGFTYSWLAPYDTWDAFKAEARELWNQFSVIGKHKVANRLAVRFINRINLSDPRPIELKRYFNIMPKMPETLGGDVDTFFMQLQISMNECTPGARAIINFAGNEASEKIHSELILDFDVFIESEFACNNDFIWTKIDGLRTCKNVLFESCITNDLREAIS